MLHLIPICVNRCARQRERLRYAKHEEAMEASASIAQAAPALRGFRVLELTVASMCEPSRGRVGNIGNMSSGVPFSEQQNDPRHRDEAARTRNIFIEKRSKGRAPRLNLVCWKCGELARLKAIEAFPFTKGVTEAVYKCLRCGSEIRHALPHG